MPKKRNNSKLGKIRKQKDVSDDSNIPDITSTWTEQTAESEERQDQPFTDPLLQETFAVEMSASDVEGSSGSPSETKLRKRPKKSKSRSDQQRLQRKIRARERVAKETFEQRLKRLKALSEYQRERIRNETPEQRKRRLQILRDNQARRLRNETAEMREKRLNKGRVYFKNLKEKSINGEDKIEDDSKTNVKRSGRRKVAKAKEI